MSENTVIVSEQNYTVTVDQTNNITVEVDRPSAGPIGFTGSTGAGFTGSAGAPGPAGSLGYTGSIGFTGSAGSAGANGFTGSRGDTGFTGSQGPIGFTGSKGDAGGSGPAGPAGYTGSIGFTGSAGSAGANGFTGSQGFSGSMGYTGSAGILGQIGYTGSRGTPSGLRFNFDTSDTTPGASLPAGVIRANETQASATSILYFSATDADGNSLNNWMATINVGSQITLMSQNHVVYVFDVYSTIGYGTDWLEVNVALANGPATSVWINQPLHVSYTVSGMTGYTGSAADFSDVNIASFDTVTGYTGSQPGDLFWDAGNGTLALRLAGNNVTLQIGQEEIVRVFNAGGATLTDGQVVYVTGAQGNRPAVALASAASEAVTNVTLGVVTETILAGQQGFVTTAGMVNNLNTAAFPQGTLLWLGAIPGTITTTKPSFPNHKVMVGYVVRSHAVVGSIFVKIQNGYELDELHDVVVTTPTAGQVLSYTGSHWANSSVIGFTGSQGGTGFTGSQGPIGFTGSAGSGAPIVLTPVYSGSMSVNVANANVVRITLTGNLTLGFTGGVDGQKFIVELVQDGVGGRTVAYDSSVRFGTDIVSTTLSTAANKIDRIGLIFNSAAGKYDLIAFSRGY